MPAILPYASRRRKGPTPIAYHKIEEVHDKVFELFGLQKLSARQTSSPSGDGSPCVNDAIKTSMSTTIKNQTKRKSGLVDLPEELQKQIFSFVSTAFDYGACLIVY